MSSPFDLNNDSGYRYWRDQKLEYRPPDASALWVEIQRPDRLSGQERSRIGESIERANMALLHCTNRNYNKKVYLTTLGACLGLRQLDENLCAGEDAISTLRVRESKPYIPYSNRPLSWHTDGYYNHPRQQVRAWTLMCHADAFEGGENLLLDHEILYILLREQDRAFIRALSAADAMTIPPNIVDGRELRPARSGPVFSVDPSDGSLHMRYSARAKNIQWKQDEALQGALAFIENLFSNGCTYIYRHRLQPGQRLVSNNVLHNRSGFRDSPEHRRVIYRARYHQRIRIAGT